MKRRGGGGYNGVVGSRDELDRGEGVIVVWSRGDSWKGGRVS